MLETAEQQAKTDKAVADDHHGGKNRLPCFGRVVRAMPDHLHHDRDLDNGDGDGENERAERLPDPGSDDLRMFERGKHRADDQRGCDERDDKLHRGMGALEPMFRRREEGRIEKREPRKHAGPHRHFFNLHPV